jgi:hypothetical protein
VKRKKIPMKRTGIGLFSGKPAFKFGNAGAADQNFFGD